MEDVKLLMLDYIMCTKEQNKNKYNKVIKEITNLYILIKHFEYEIHPTFFYNYSKYYIDFWEEFMDELDNGKPFKDWI